MPTRAKRRKARRTPLETSPKHASKAIMKPITSRRRLLSAAFAAALLPTATNALAQSASAPPVPGASVSPGRWITLAELETSLPNSPITVGFDIDDTLVFSSPSFNAVLNARDANGVNPYGANRRAVIGNPKAWEDLHSIHDAYVLPKAIGAQLLALHQRRLLSFRQWCALRIGLYRGRGC